MINKNLKVTNKVTYSLNSIYMQLPQRKID